MVRAIGAVRACSTFRFALADGSQRASLQIMRPAHEAGQAWCTAAGSSDVGNRAVGERQAGVCGPTRGTERRTALGSERRPQSQVLHDAPDDCRIVDQHNDAQTPDAVYFSSLPEKLAA